MAATDPVSGWTCRLPYRSAQDTEGEVARVLSKLEASDNDLTVLRAMANASHAFRPFVLLSDALLNRGVLPRRCRELVILGLAGELDVAYERHEHETMAERAGVTEEQRAALRDGFGHPVPGVTAAEAVALATAAELLRDHRISDEAWAAMVEAWGEDGAMDLALTVGWWGGLVPMAIGALGLQPVQEAAR
jgi:alkylhydroperoxidase/carboxymuconolactone decarboxylase family protein YurZ